MPDALPDIYIRFSKGEDMEPGDELFSPDLVGESIDRRNPGDTVHEEDIPADVTDKGWFTVTSFTFSIAGSGGDEDGKDGKDGKGSTAKSKTPSKAGAATSKEPFKGINVTMPLQLGCTYLMQYAVQFAQKHQKEQEFEKIPRVEFRVRRSGLTIGDDGASKFGQGVFFSIFLWNVTVENYTMNSSCVAETFTLNYEKLYMVYLATDPETRELAVYDPHGAGAAWNEAYWSLDAKNDDTPP